MNLKNQRAIAAKLLKVGVNRVTFNQARLEDAAEALTREDVRSLIKNGVITARPDRATSRSRAKDRAEQKRKGRRKGYGKRSGKKTTRQHGKESWIKKVRSLRDELRKLKLERR
jgi:large subunit ribosomal protein L19e